MIAVTVTVDAADSQRFLVEVQGKLKNPKALNTALGKRLARELQGHFSARNSEPNTMGATKTNFWETVSGLTQLTDVNETEATVSIGEVRFRIHLHGGTIKPTGGRKFLTIPLIPEARGKRVSEWEAEHPRQALFRVGNALMERTDQGDRSFLGAQKATVRRNGVFRSVNVRARSQIRGV